MRLCRLLYFFGWIGCLSLLPCVQADDDDAGNGQYQNGDDYIKYWGEYAILPKRCIV